MQKKSTRPLGQIRKHLAPPSVNGAVVRRSSGGDILNKEFKYKEPEGVDHRRQSFNPQMLVDKEAPKNGSVVSSETFVREHDTLLRERREFETKERKLKAQMEHLENQISLLKASLTGREDEVTELTIQIKTIILQQDKYKELYENEVEAHKETKRMVEKLQRKLSKRDEEITQLKEEHESRLVALVKKYEDDISNMIAKKDEEIAERDERIAKMKKQMAEAFDGKAWERQHQIEDLTKELKKSQEDAEMLQMKLRQSRRKTSTVCPECEVLKKDLSTSDDKLKEAKGIIDSLYDRCSEFEEQLKQQGKFLNDVARRQKGKPNS